MDKLETAKQAALVADYETYDVEVLFDAAIRKWMASGLEYSNYDAYRDGFGEGHEKGFDAGVAYQGEWTAINTIDDLPKISGEYIWQFRFSGRMCGQYFNVDKDDRDWAVNEYIAWREISKYQPVGGEGE